MSTDISSTTKRKDSLELRLTAFYTEPVHSRFLPFQACSSPAAARAQRALDYYVSVESELKAHIVARDDSSCLLSSQFLLGNCLLHLCAETTIRVPELVQLQCMLVLSPLMLVIFAFIRVQHEWGATQLACSMQATYIRISYASRTKSLALQHSSSSSELAPLEEFSLSDRYISNRSVCRNASICSKSS